MTDDRATFEQAIVGMNAMAKSIREVGLSFQPTVEYRFAVDVGESMKSLGVGYDPYNHVGYDVVSECLGQDCRA